jgi:hypothetical protein
VLKEKGGERTKSEKSRKFVEKHAKNFKKIDKTRTNKNDKTHATNTDEHRRSSTNMFASMGKTKTSRTASRDANAHRRARSTATCAFLSQRDKYDPEKKDAQLGVARAACEHNPQPPPQLGKCTKKHENMGKYATQNTCPEPYASTCPELTASGNFLRSLTKFCFFFQKAVKIYARNTSPVEKRAFLPCSFWTKIAKNCEKL